VVRDPGCGEAAGLAGPDAGLDALRADRPALRRGALFGAGCARFCGHAALDPCRSQLAGLTSRSRGERMLRPVVNAAEVPGPARIAGILWSTGSVSRERSRMSSLDPPSAKQTDTPSGCGARLNQLACSPACAQRPWLGCYSPGSRDRSAGAEKARAPASGPENGLSARFSPSPPWLIHPIRANAALLTAELVLNPGPTAH
jgi:hypothetical protein